MDMALVLKNYFSQLKIELGNRSMYVGASDVAQCPRKAVLSKTHPAAEDLNTLIRYERGTMLECIVENALDHAGIPYERQAGEKKQTGNDGSAFEAGFAGGESDKGKSGEITTKVFRLVPKTYQTKKGLTAETP